MSPSQKWNDMVSSHCCVLFCVVWDKLHMALMDCGWWQQSHSINLPPQLWRKHRLGNRNLYHSWASVSRRGPGNPDSSLWLHFFPSVTPKYSTKNRAKQNERERRRAFCNSLKCFNIQFFHQASLMWEEVVKIACIWKSRLLLCQREAQLTLTPSPWFIFSNLWALHLQFHGLILQRGTRLFPKIFPSRTLVSRRISKVFREFWWHF